MKYMAEFNDIVMEQRQKERRDRNRNLALGSAVGAFLGSKAGEMLANRSSNKTIKDNEYANKGAVVGGALGFLGTGAAMSAYDNWKQGQLKKKDKGRSTATNVALGLGGLGTIGAAGYGLKKAGVI
jgi:uncharacterized membrane protein YebE (DUF533 family)